MSKSRSKERHKDYKNIEEHIEARYVLARENNDNHNDGRGKARWGSLTKTAARTRISLPWVCAFPSRLIAGERIEEIASPGLCGIAEILPTGKSGATRNRASTFMERGAY